MAERISATGSVMAFALGGALATGSPVMRFKIDDICTRGGHDFRIAQAGTPRISLTPNLDGLIATEDKPIVATLTEADVEMLEMAAREGVVYLTDYNPYDDEDDDE